MFNEKLVLNILEQINIALEKISFRFSPVKDISDFIDSPQGMEKLDSICMLFMAIGESIKQIDKITESNFLKQYPQTDWKGVKGFRDVISHHYFDIDAEEVFYVCKNELAGLSATIKLMIKDLSE